MNLAYIAGICAAEDWMFSAYTTITFWIKDLPHIFYYGCLSIKWYWWSPHVIIVVDLFLSLQLCVGYAFGVPIAWAVLNPKILYQGG